MRSREVLLLARDIVERFGDEKALRSYYLEFHRRLEVLELVEEYYPSNGVVADLGSRRVTVHNELCSQGDGLQGYSCGYRARDLR
jgi:hypothetical protein